jgi:hypothetical protein
MGKATTVVTPQLRDKLYARADFTVIKDEMWDDHTRFLKFLHPEAPDGRHVDVILEGPVLRFKPDADV